MGEKKHIIRTEEKKEMLYVKQMLGFDYEISYDDETCFYDIEELIYYWKYDSMISSSMLFKNKLKILDDALIKNVKGTLQNMRYSCDQKLLPIDNKISKLYTLWICEIC